MNRVNSKVLVPIQWQGGNNMKRYVHNVCYYTLIGYLVFLFYLTISTSAWAEKLFASIMNCSGALVLLPLLCFGLLDHCIPSKRDGLHFAKEQADTLQQIDCKLFQKGEELLFVEYACEPKAELVGPIQVSGGYLFATPKLWERLTPEQLEPFVQLFVSINACSFTQKTRNSIRFRMGRRWLRLRIKTSAYRRAVLYFAPDSRKINKFSAPYWYGKLLDNWYH